MFIFIIANLVSDNFSSHHRDFAISFTNANKLANQTQQMYSYAVKEAADPLHLEVLDRLYPKIQRSICKVLNKDSQGTGGLVALRISNGNTAYSFVTCNHVLGSNDSVEIYNTTLQFYASRERPALVEPPCVKIKPEWIYFVWNSSDQYFDSTVIEFNEIGRNALFAMGAEFLDVTEPFAGQEVIMFGYASGKLGVDHNVIEKLDEYKIVYHMGAKNGSSGSPILTQTGEIVGVHRLRIEHAQQVPANQTQTLQTQASQTSQVQLPQVPIDPLGNERQGSNIMKMIKAFSKERSRLYSCLSIYEIKITII